MLAYKSEQDAGLCHEMGRTCLHLDVQHHDTALGPLLLNGHLARAVPVAPELGVLDEALGVDQRLEVLHGDVMVVDAALLAGPRVPRGVRDRQRERLRVPREEHLVQSALADP